MTWLLGDTALAQPEKAKSRNVPQNCITTKLCPSPKYTLGLSRSIKFYSYPMSSHPRSSCKLRTEYRPQAPIRLQRAWLNSSADPLFGNNCRTHALPSRSERTIWKRLARVSQKGLKKLDMPNTQSSLLFTCHIKQGNSNCRYPILCSWIMQQNPAIHRNT